MDTLLGEATVIIVLTASEKRYILNGKTFLPSAWFLYILTNDILFCCFFSLFFVVVVFFYTYYIIDMSLETVIIILCFILYFAINYGVFIYSPIRLARASIHAVRIKGEVFRAL